MGTTEALHDAQDAAEDLADDARKAVETTVVDAIGPALDAIQGEPVVAVFEYLASLVEEPLAPITTKAVRVGFDVARRLRRG